MDPHGFSGPRAAPNNLHARTVPGAGIGGAGEAPLELLTKLTVVFLVLGRDGCYFASPPDHPLLVPCLPLKKT